MPISYLNQIKIRFIYWVLGSISLYVTKSRLFPVHIQSVYLFMSIIYLILFILYISGSIINWFFKKYNKVLLFTTLPFLPSLTLCSSVLQNINHTLFKKKKRQAVVLYFLAHTVPVIQCCYLILYIDFIYMTLLVWDSF